MTVKLISLRGLPEDEIDEIRSLLQQHQVDFYETPGGNWGISMPALWLREDSSLAHCKALLDEYQQERCTRMRTEYLQRKQRGEVDTLLDRIKQQPLRIILYLAFLALILYVSTMPFLDFE
ncbi:MAG: DUF6164 family protein [Thiohalomonadales bacterium]